MHKLGGSEGGTRVDHGEICGSDGEFGKHCANKSCELSERSSDCLLLERRSHVSDLVVLLKCRKLQHALHEFVNSIMTSQDTTDYSFTHMMMLVFH